MPQLLRVVCARCCSVQQPQWYLHVGRLLLPILLMGARMPPPLLPSPAGALPADVATKAGHQLAARHLRAAADGSSMSQEPPTREALVERFLAASGAGGSRRGSRHGGPNRSIKCAAAGEALDVSAVALKAPPGQGGQLQEATLAAASMKLAAPVVRDVLAAAGSSCGAAPAAAHPAGEKGAGGRDRESSMHGGAEGLRARRKAATERLVQRGFEGWGTPGVFVCSSSSSSRCCICRRS